jgi:hypothetical protein
VVVEHDLYMLSLPNSYSDDSAEDVKSSFVHLKKLVPRHQDCENKVRMSACHCGTGTNRCGTGTGVVPVPV